MAEVNGQIALTIGVLLAAALLAGLVAERLHLPKVTAYLLVGLLLGPHTVESLPDEVFRVIPQRLLALTTIPADHVDLLSPFVKFAIALVLFNMGCGMAFKQLLPHIRSIVRLSCGELLLTFVLVSVGLVCLRESWSVALLFGSLALATAPATTVLVLKENRSEGPVTRYANALVVLNNIAAIVVFELLFMLVIMTRGDVKVSLTSSFLHFLLDLAGATGLGVLAGLVVAVGCGFLSRSRWLVLVVAVSTAMLGVCEQYGLPYLLTFLIMGMTLANSSDRAKDVVAQLDQLTGLMCVVFFVVHGTELNVRALVAAGVIGVGYTVLRILGKYFGIYLAASYHEGECVKKWLGATLMAQAGAAIALAEIAAARYPAIGAHLQHVILGTVVIFEIGGPIFIRQAVIQAGEVPLDSAIHHTEASLLGELKTIVTRLLSSLGRMPAHPIDLASLTVGDCMHRYVQGIPSSATFQSVVAFIEQSHDNALPVVDDDGVVVGVISYRELADEHFDPGLGALVRAEDLALTSFPRLCEHDPAKQAWHEFQQTPFDCLPVVTDQRPHRLVGILRRRDLNRSSR